MILRKGKVEDNGQMSVHFFENQKELGPAFQNHQAIFWKGQGKYDLWGDSLIFSPSDNTDPRTNGRHYKISYQRYLKSRFFYGTLISITLFYIALWIGQFVRKYRILQPETFSQALKLIDKKFWGLLGIFIVGLVLLNWAYGAWFWLCMGMVVIPLLFLVKTLLEILFRLVGIDCSLAFVPDLALLMFTLFFTFMGGEILLANYHPPTDQVHKMNASTKDIEAMEVLFSPEARAAKAYRSEFKVMPDSWKIRIINLKDESSAYYWQGVLHVQDKDGFRRKNGPFPRKQPGVFRVLVVGDSYTYAQGIEDKWSYTSVLSQAMQKQYRIEFINLSVLGFHSEDILYTIERFLDVVKPDLVIYGVAQSDILPSGRGSYTANKAQFPLPAPLKAYFIHRTKIAQLFAWGYNGLLHRLHVRYDFVEDVMKDFENYQACFVQNIRKMNRFVTTRHLPPIIAMVQNHFIDYPTGRIYKMSYIVEKKLGETGVNIIPTEKINKAFSGKSFVVSKWEGHPNEEMHAIWAEMIREKLMTLPELKKYRRSP